MPATQSAPGTAPGTAPAPGTGTGTTSAPGTARSQVVVFVLGGEEFALPVQSVEQIDGPLAVHPLPLAATEPLECLEGVDSPDAPPPARLRGVARLRGQAVPVLDLDERLSVTPGSSGGPGAPGAAGPESRTLILSVSGRLVALVVDRVSEVLCLPAAAVGPAPGAGGAGGAGEAGGAGGSRRGMAPSFVRGVIRVKGRSVLLLDAERLIEQRDLAAMPIGH